MTQILPVIHHLHNSLAIAQAQVAYEAGADGIFLISHHGQSYLLPSLAEEIKAKYDNFKVGINLLGVEINEVARLAKEYNLDMIWGDACGVSSKGLDKEGELLSTFARDNKNIEVFASVSFKCQPTDINPPLAGLFAQNAGFIPTTSGSGTGSPPTVEKIQSMSLATGGLLGVASGMTCENVSNFSSYLSHILVATGVSIDDHHFDVELLNKFVQIVKNN